MFLPRLLSYSVRNVSSTSLRIVRGQHSATANSENQSTANKKLISKILGLKLSFLNDLNFSVIRNSNQIAFNYNYFDVNKKIGKHQIQFTLNYDQPEKSINGCFKEVNPKRSEFMFLFFDSQLFQMLSSDDVNEEFPDLDTDSITIFDDPFNALAFYQQTKLPTVVFKFSNSKEINHLGLHQFCGKIEKRFKKVYFWSNNVNFCRKFCKMWMKHFDRSKLLRITSVESAFQMLHLNNKEKFGSILKSAILPDRPGILPVSETLENCLNRLNDKQIQGVQWARFGKLNEHLKGHRPGELTIITGPTGCGKTTFVSEYSLDLCEQGVHTLWGSFEINYLDLEKMMMTQLVGKNIDSIQREEFDQAWAKFAQLPLFFLNFHGQTNIKEVLKEAEHSVWNLGVEHLVIDNFQFMLGLTGDSTVDRFYKQDLVLGTIRQFATKFNCHVTLVAHPRKEKDEMILSNNSLYGGIKTSQEADNIMIIMNKYHPRFKCNKYVQITKNRAHGNLGVVPLYFDKTTLCFSSHHKTEKQSNTRATVPDISQSAVFRAAPSQPAFVENELLDMDKQEDEAKDRQSSLNSRVQFDDSNPEEIHYGNFKAFLLDQRKNSNV